MAGRTQPQRPAAVPAAPSARSVQPAAAVVLQGAAREDHQVVYQEFGKHFRLAKGSQGKDKARAQRLFFVCCLWPCCHQRVQRLSSKSRHRSLWVPLGSGMRRAVGGLGRSRRRLVGTARVSRCACDNSSSFPGLDLDRRHYLLLLTCLQGLSAYSGGPYRRPFVVGFQTSEPQVHCGDCRRRRRRRLAQLLGCSLANRSTGTPRISRHDGGECMPRPQSWRRAVSRLVASVDR